MASSPTSPPLQQLCSPNVTTVDENNKTSISTVHQDILETHILTRLDGPTLASASCASTHLRALASQDNLWTNICHATWPSTSCTGVRHVISNFHNGSRSFFSDAFPSAIEPASIGDSSDNLDLPSELISVVDIYHKKKLIFSKIVETEAVSNWFKCSPFRVDLLDPKEAVPTRVPYPDKDDTCKDLEDDMEMSWIMIDTIGKRAVNISSQRPVTVHRHWLTGEVQVKYASILTGGRIGTTTELVRCGVVVTCGGSARGEMHVREVSLQLEDLDGMYLNGKDSLENLKRGLEGKRGKGKIKGMERKKEIEDFLKMKREGTLDMLCVAFGVLAFASSALFIFIKI